MGFDFVQEKIFCEKEQGKCKKKTKRRPFIGRRKVFKHVIFSLALAAYNTKEHIKSCKG